MENFASGLQWAETAVLYIINVIISWFSENLVNSILTILRRFSSPWFTCRARCVVLNCQCHSETKLMKRTYELKYIEENLFTVLMLGLM